MGCLSRLHSTCTGTPSLGCAHSRGKVRAAHPDHAACSNVGSWTISAVHMMGGQAACAWGGGREVRRNVWPHALWCARSVAPLCSQVGQPCCEAFGTLNFHWKHYELRGFSILGDGFLKILKLQLNVAGHVQPHGASLILVDFHKRQDLEPHVTNCMNGVEDILLRTF